MIMVDFQWSIPQTCCFPRVDTAMGRPSVGMTGRYILPPLSQRGPSLRYSRCIQARRIRHCGRGAADGGHVSAHVAGIIARRAGWQFERHLTERWCAGKRAVCSTEFLPIGAAPVSFRLVAHANVAYL